MVKNSILATFILILGALIRRISPQFLFFFFLVELLNAQEFGQEKEYDENKINSALELGLLVSHLV